VSYIGPRIICVLYGAFWAKRCPYTAVVTAMQPNWQHSYAFLLLHLTAHYIVFYMIYFIACTSKNRISVSLSAVTELVQTHAAHVVSIICSLCFRVCIFLFMFVGVFEKTFRYKSNICVVCFSCFYFSVQ
jgi:hypothetical protein